MTVSNKLVAFLLVIILLIAPGIARGKTDKSKWEQVLGNGHGPGSGFGNPANTSIDTLINIKSGLYASTWNNTTGTEIWKSTDGTTWMQMAKDGFGDPKNATVHFATSEFEGYLYGGTDNSATTNEGVDIPGEGAEIFRSNGKTWERVMGKGMEGTRSSGFGDPNNIEISALAVFRSHLYAATESYEHAGEVWRTSDGTTWQKVASDVFGKENIGFTSLIEFESQLYGVSWNRSGMEIWRTQDGVNWSQVMKGGFGYERNQFAKAAQIFKDRLYIGTSWNNTTGGQVWRSKDGTDWVQVNQSGFGDPANTDVTSLLIYGGKIYAGAAGPGSASAKIYASTDGNNWQAVLTPGLEAGGIFAAGSTAMTQRQGMLYAATSSKQGIDIWRMKLEIVAPQTKPPLKLPQKGSGWSAYVLIAMILALIIVLLAAIVIILSMRKKST